MMSDRRLTKLMGLRDMWAKTGVLHDLQVLQLQTWGLCLCPSKTKSSETRIDTDNWIIEFHIKPEFLASFTTPKQAVAMCPNLEHWVHQLLDGRVLVKVYWAKNLIFTGVRVADLPEVQEGTDFSAGASVPETPWKPNPKIKY